LLIALLGVITLASVDLLLAQDGLPGWFPAHAHELLATLCCAQNYVAPAQ